MLFRSEMAVNAVAVWDRSSTWHKEKMASSPYWTSLRAWSQSLVRSAMEQTDEKEQKTPFTTLIFSISKMVC